MQPQSARVFLSGTKRSRFSIPNLLTFILMLIFPLAFASRATASANSVYLAQSEAGTADGADCADAYAYSFFNTSANWGSGTTQIGPGTTVHLCGTITSPLTFRGSGASGSPVVLDGTGATMSAYINVGTQYWTIQNCTWSTSYGTNSATQAVIQTSNGAAFGTIQNNHIDVINSSQVIFFHGTTHDITVLNNYLKVSTPNGAGFDTDVIDTEGAYNVMVQGNYIAMNIGAADASCGGCHDDLTQVWGSVGPTYNWTFRYNYFVQESSSSITNNLSLMMLEQIGNTPGYWDVYSNVFQCVSGGNSGNGIVFDSNYSGMTAHIYNNTIVQNSGACNNLFNLSGAGSFNLENNIIYNSSAGNALTGGVKFATRGDNLWYGPNTPSCVATEICGQNPLFTNFAGNHFSLQSGSPASGAGANLGTNYNQYPLPGATWPNPTLGTRPASGNWDIGAYDGVAGTTTGPPAPPTGLTATVQ